MRRTCFAAAAAAAFLLSVAAVGAEPTLPPESDAWIRVKTAHFTVFSEVSERRTADLGRRLERFRAALGKFNKKFVLDPPVDTFLFVFKDDASLTPYKPRFNGKPVELAGYFVGGSDGNYIAVNGARQGDPLEVIYHEYTHHFLGNNLHNIPPWFNEGLAECYEKFQSDEKGASIGLTQNEHVLYLRQHALLPLHDLFAITHSSEDYNEGDRRGVFYAESWALMHYLLWDKPERRAQFTKFLDRLTAGEQPDTAFPAAFETSYQTLENELRNYIGGSRFLFTRLTVADLGVDDQVTTAPMKRAEILSHLGDMLAHLDRDRIAEAARYYEEARRVDAAYAPAWAGLGHAACLSGRRDEGIPLLDKAVALDPQDAMGHFRLAECLAERDADGTGDLKRATDMFLKTIALRQGFAEAYVDLAGVLMRQGANPAQAIHLLEAARPALPSRIDVVLNLAQLYAHKGDAAHAHDLVENVLGRMNDTQALEEGRRFVAQAAARAAASTPPAAGSPATAGTPVDDGQEFVVDSPSTESYNDQFNRHLLAYNQAVALANKRDYKGAIAILETLQKQETDATLRGETGALLERLRKDAARQPKSGG